MSSPFLGGAPRPFGDPVTISGQGTSARLAAVSSSANLAGRKGVAIWNTGSTKLNVYTDVGLTKLCGFVPSDNFLPFVASDGESYWIATASGTTDVIMYEYKAG